MPGSLIQHRSARSWLKIIIQVDSRMADAVAAYLSGLSGTGLEISAAAGDHDNMTDTFPDETITAYIANGPHESDRKAAASKIAELRQFLLKLKNIFPCCPVPDLLTASIQEEDWGEKWKRFFTSFKVTPSLTVRPSWEDGAGPEGTGDAAEFVIDMDPGMAFGTGHHASTQLALLLLEELFQNNKLELNTILDVGTGSGILAMACALFGAQKVVALDNDSDAVVTARQNVLKNHLADKITVSNTDAASVHEEFDLVVANITHDTLQELAKSLVSTILPGGFLVLSGILSGEQERSIGAIYTTHGLGISKRMAKDEWSALIFQKN